MTEEQAHTAQDPLAEESAADARADVKAILVIFGALLLMAVHFISGWTFDLG